MLCNSLIPGLSVVEPFKEHDVPAIPQVRQGVQNAGVLVDDPAECLVLIGGEGLADDHDVIGPTVATCLTEDCIPRPQGVELKPCEALKVNLNLQRSALDFVWCDDTLADRDVPFSVVLLIGNNVDEAVVLWCIGNHQILVFQCNHPSL